MAKLTPAQVYALAVTHGGLSPTAAVIATAIAIGESGLNPDAVGDVGLQNGTWGPSIGLWQVRSVKAESGTGKSRDATRLKDPVFNARAMGEISGHGKNWRPWSVYTSGNYKKNLPTVAASVGAGVDDTVSSSDFAGASTDATGDVEKVGPFDSWTSDLLAIGLKLAVTGAALWLVVAGVRATVDNKN